MYALVGFMWTLDQNKTWVKQYANAIIPTVEGFMAQSLVYCIALNPLSGPKDGTFGSTCLYVDSGL